MLHVPATPPACFAQALHFDLQVTLTLQADGLRPAWRAVLLGSEPDNALRFESMPELIRYLAQLGAGMSARGIR